LSGKPVKEPKMKDRRKSVPGLGALATLVALLLLTGPATGQASAVRYSGWTDGGGAIGFTLKGKRITGINGTVPTVCLESAGSYQTRAGAELFRTPGAFLLGRTKKAKALQPAAMNRGTKATKN
jgi:hypothetical protein